MDSDINDRVFDTEKTREVFMKLVNLHFLTSHFKENRESLHFIENICEVVQDPEKDLDKPVEKPKRYVRKKKAITIPKNKNIGKTIISFSKIYVILMDAHIKFKHHIPHPVREHIEKQYVIPSICFDFIPKACNICCETPGAEAPRNGFITFLHQMTHRGEFKNCDSALIYVDEFSEYTLVRPIISASSQIDTTMEIFKLFMEIGPPDKVCIGIYPMQEPHVQEFLNFTLPHCKITYEPQYSKSCLTTRVVTGIVEWMQVTDCKAWEVGCPFVQLRINHEWKPCVEASITAHDLFFNLKQCNINKATDNTADTIENKDSISNAEGENTKYIVNISNAEGENTKYIVNDDSINEPKCIENDETNIENQDTS